MVRLLWFELLQLLLFLPLPLSPFPLFPFSSRLPLFPFSSRPFGLFLGEPPLRKDNDGEWQTKQKAALWNQQSGNRISPAPGSIRNDCKRRRKILQDLRKLAITFFPYLFPQHDPAKATAQDHQ